MSTFGVALPLNESLLPRSYGFADDFINYTSGQLWTSVATGVGAGVAVSNSLRGGVLNLTTGATNNNEAYASNTNGMFSFLVDGQIDFDSRVQFTEAATNASAMAVGLMDAVATLAIPDGGLTLKSSFSGAMFWKPKGSTTWSVVTSIGSTNVSTVLSAANSLDRQLKTSGGGVWQRLGIVAQQRTSTEVEVSYSINETIVAKHTIASAGAALMQTCALAKAGGANSEVLRVDYIRCRQTR